MSGRIPSDVIDKIREDTAIEEIVGKFVSLTRKGESLWGLCPFHNEKSSSFHVRPARGSYYCFGCQRGGGVFQFLMDKEGMSFPESVEYCADRLGIDLDRYRRRAEDGPDPSVQLLAANRWAAEWFAEQLHTPLGKAALDYALARGLSEETIEAFGVGFAPAGNNALRDGAEKAQISLESLLQASILRRSDQREPFAYFRSRLIFPIRGVGQKTYGFGGRILGPGEPKYLNSPETSVFRKRHTLYALPEARSDMVRRREAILVEGYLDALSLHQAGWPHTVATCGTAFTPEQAKQLGRWVDRLILLFDGDSAGRKAAYRSADVALAAGLDVRIVRLPSGKDPADLVLEGSVETLRDALQEAPSLVECMAREVEERGGDRSAKERALRHLRETVVSVPDPIRAQSLLDEAAQRFEVPVQALQPTSTPQALPTAPEPLRQTDTDERTLEVERKLLALALMSRRARRMLVERVGVDGFVDAVHRDLVSFLQEVPAEVDAIDGRNLDDGLDAAAQSVAARMILERPAGEFDAVAELEGQLNRLQRRRDRAASRRDKAELDESYMAGEDWKERLRRVQNSPLGETDPTDPSPSDPDGGTTS